ncbi:hypothetical protein QAD02_019987 [Eretmocerus hayati]|uniref:Uncharacterized protein n=1 Tax=Eretmocerus hayati TaxID=131215 RepID=A0ACC2PQY0_9HYME|nr:hypothetical protein QAD02_019987 [Eretmocerus hayati]
MILPTDKKHCVIVGCDSTRNELVFKFPKDQQLGLKWLSSIKNPAPDALEYKDVEKYHVCHKHFSDIEKAGCYIYQPYHLTGPQNCPTSVPLMPIRENAEVVTEARIPGLKCDCGLAPKLLTRSFGADRGRRFLKCSKTVASKEVCLFFRWVSGLVAPETPTNETISSPRKSTGVQESQVISAMSMNPPSTSRQICSTPVCASSPLSRKRQRPDESSMSDHVEPEESESSISSSASTPESAVPRTFMRGNDLETLNLKLDLALEEKKNLKRQLERLLQENEMRDKSFLLKFEKFYGSLNVIQKMLIDMFIDNLERHPNGRRYT